MSEENEIDLLDLIDMGKHMMKSFTSLVKSIDEAKVEYDKLSHSRENAANQHINTPPDITGESKNTSNPLDSSSSKIIDVELDSTGKYRVAPKRLPKK